MEAIKMAFISEKGKLSDWTDYVAFIEWTEN